MRRHRLRCSEVWGGIKDEDVDARSASLDVSLISKSCAGGSGGDIYYFSVCDADLLTRVALADVVGHGERVSHVSRWLFEAMQRQMNNLEGNRILSALNELAVQRGIAAMTTAAVAAFDREDSNLYFSYAGHHPVLILRCGERHWHEARVNPGAELVNLPLGVLPDGRYDQAHVALRPGDRIAMYTDGLIEAPAPGGEQFGIDGLRRVLDREATSDLHQIKSAVVAAVRDHTGGSLAHDDVTFLVAEARA